MVVASKTILVVEAGGAIGEALQRHGYRVVTALDARGALAELACAPVPPALIVLDWVMPDDGLSFLGSCASEPRYGRLPVVVMSEMSRMEKIPSLYVTVVLTKPVRTRTLIEVLDRLCGRAVDGGPRHGRAPSNHDGNTTPIRRRTPV